MNTEKDEFRRIERKAKRRTARDDDDDTQGYVSEFALPLVFLGMLAGFIWAML